MENILKDLWRDYWVYYWTKDKLSENQVRVGLNSEAYLILSFDPKMDKCTLERTVFRGYQETATLSPLSFSNGTTEYRVIKDIIRFISPKLDTQEMKDRNTVSQDNLVDNTTPYINRVFDF